METGKGNNNGTVVRYKRSSQLNNMTNTYTPISNFERTEVRKLRKVNNMIQWFMILIILMVLGLVIWAIIKTRRKADDDDAGVDTDDTPKCDSDDVEDAKAACKALRGAHRGDDNLVQRECENYDVYNTYYTRTCVHDEGDEIRDWEPESLSEHLYEIKFENDHFARIKSMDDELNMTKPDRIEFLDGAKNIQLCRQAKFQGECEYLSNPDMVTNDRAKVEILKLLKTPGTVKSIRVCEGDGKCSNTMNEEYGEGHVLITKNGKRMVLKDASDLDMQGRKVTTVVDLINPVDPQEHGMRNLYEGHHGLVSFFNSRK